MVGAFECRGRIIGTVRIIPMNQGLAPCEAVLERQSLLPGHYYENSWEIGRLVIGPQYRHGYETVKKCLQLTLLHLVEAVNIKNGFALCNPVLGRLYRRFGFSVVVKNAWEGSTGSFSLIHGPVAAVLNALAEPGASGPSPHEVTQ
ncbi:N-acyl amino acid synthase FeeM domain-containing protein [Caenimonas soli]|uniref:N-acyl amino acid synthase FeeM domain-containing protein n=1 Tax=Caenimonas soli TaxID=2735555 RepID=UPI0038B3A14F